MHGTTNIKYQNKHYNINERDEGTSDDRGRDGGTNYILRIKEQETRLNLHEHNDDDDDSVSIIRKKYSGKFNCLTLCSTSSSYTI